MIVVDGLETKLTDELLHVGRCSVSAISFFRLPRISSMTSLMKKRLPGLLVERRFKIPSAKFGHARESFLFGGYVPSHHLVG